MNNVLTDDLFEEWQSLAREWKAAVTNYELAMRSFGPGLASGERSDAVEKACAHLEDLKRQMDAVVAVGAARRRDQITQRDHLVAGTLHRNAEVAEI
jgi:hypothetical protein